MSLVFQMISSGGGTAAQGMAGTQTAAVSAAAGVPFAQTLVQQMNAGAGQLTAANAQTAGMADVMALLQGMLMQAQPEEAGQTQAEGAEELLAKLLQDAEKLDEQVQADPALLAALQSWLLQAAALLTAGGGEAGEQEQAEPQQVTLTPLAEKAETVTFAVQDELHKLVQVVQSAADGGDAEQGAKAAAMLQTFAELANHLTKKSSADSAALTQQNQTAIMQVSGEAGVNADSGAPLVQQENKPNVPGQNAAELSKTQTADVKLVDPGAKQAEGVKPQDALQKLAAAAEAVKPAQTGETEPAEPAQEIGSMPAKPEVVTAGQLALRSGAPVLLKAEAAPVPVQHFAKEMTGMITGSLEIVRKGSVAEATLTLFPENLGQVDVKITMQNGQLIAHFVADHKAAKELLDQQMVQLRASLQSQGIQVERLEVTQSQASPDSQMYQSGRQAGGNGQQQEGRRSREREEDNGDAVLAAELTGEWKEWLENGEVDRRQDGGSFHAKA
ncbi:flagellar hook-length control protein FliK [Paenibacillus sp. CN-4]|uniref:flagellar hook-length control protein FliK n=1 Tax=Paenibacillus nanchangensis TaxID=3348343 RepID=UPI00397C501F